MNIHKILLPLDLLESSQPVGLIRQAAILARHFNAEIQVLHVVKPLTYVACASVAHEMLERGLSHHEEKLREALGSEFAGLAIRHVVLKGDPAHKIVEFAHEEKIDLILMPTHAYGTLEKVLFGSVADTVLHRSECPVWIISLRQQPHSDEFAIRRVLCAVDFGPHSGELVRAAQAMATEFGAKLTLVHVTPDTQIYGPGGYHELRAMKDELFRAANGHFADLQKQIGTQADVVIASGDISKALHEVAGKVGADLLMIRSRARGARLGTHGYGIVRESQIPVLSI